jgi:bifunctional non-homologous end joining protein LigD
MGLSEYQRKRNFGKTPEPRGKPVKKGDRELSFVVQKHDASHLHYDFRLELDGVLKSWAVPKGPDLDPANKRLAMQVEDHPIEYGGFEGVIPQGQYGGGTVMLWDRGVWEPIGDPAKGYREGRLKFNLRGEKLNGGWMLVRRGGRAGESDERHWFLFKERDDFARAGEPITTKMPLSVATGRDLAEIARQSDRVWGPAGEENPHGGKNNKTRASEKHAAAPRRASRAAAVNGQGDEFAGVRLSHPDKVLFPDQGATKRDLAAYYSQVADWILPHIVGRPLALVRCPSGSAKSCFFQKHPGEGAPDELRQINVAAQGAPEYHVAVDDLPGLIALAQLGVLEIHVWGSRARALEKPDRLIFDLDPDPSVEWQQVVVAARETRLVLKELGLTSFLKTTGGKGLHVVVPIQARTEWDDAKAFCRSVAELMVRAAPDRYIATMSKAKRKGKIFIDYLRNGRGATAVAPYSTRARPFATVSVPITWEELSANLRSDQFTIENLPLRLRRLKKDPWADLATTRQSITAAMRKRLNSL